MAALPSAWTAIICGIRSIMPSLLKSVNPFHKPAKIVPSPTATITLSGASQSICSQISNAQVFLPSRVNGLNPAAREYQPYFCTDCLHSSKASSYEPSTPMTSAPYTSSCTSFGSGTDFGAKMTALSGVLAVKQASESLALPVEASAMTSCSSSSARATATALPRSLMDPVGLRPSSLISKLEICSSLASSLQG